MNVFMANATSEERQLVADSLGPGRIVGSLDELSGGTTWPIAIVMLRSAASAQKEIRKVRSQIGPSPVLVGICPVLDIDPPGLIEAGLDDLAQSLEVFLVRYPFFVARLRQRALRHLRLEAILESTVDGIVVIDQRGIIQSVNPAVSSIFGYAPHEIIGRNVSMLMPRNYAQQHDQYIANYLETRIPRIIGIGREVVGRRKDGSVFPLDLAVSEARVDNKSVFAGVVRDISERRRLEAEVLRVGEEERRRIGQDLHDGLGQMLTGIGLIAQNVGRALRSEGHAAAEDVEEVASLIREADQQARLLARGLVPVELDREGLATALEDLCGKAQRLFGGECAFERTGAKIVADGNVAANLYRIAQEAISNAFKHGKADRVQVSLVATPDAIGLRVKDNGVGFPEVLPEDRGMGVRIMHYRAGVIGGHLRIYRKGDEGTIVSCDIPVTNMNGTNAPV